jgi:hypothetical protein
MGTTAKVRVSLMPFFLRRFALAVLSLLPLLVQSATTNAATQYLNLDLHDNGSTNDVLVLSWAIDNTTTSGQFTVSSLVFAQTYLANYSPGSPTGCTTACTTNRRARLLV